MIVFVVVVVLAAVALGAWLSLRWLLASIIEAAVRGEHFGPAPH